MAGLMVEKKVASTVVLMVALMAENLAALMGL
jgi:hypothetical protein